MFMAKFCVRNRTQYGKVLSISFPHVLCTLRVYMCYAHSEYTVYDKIFAG